LALIHEQNPRVLIINPERLVIYSKKLIIYLEMIVIHYVQSFSAFRDARHISRVPLPYIATRNARHTRIFRDAHDIPKDAYHILRDIYHISRDAREIFIVAQHISREYGCSSHIERSRDAHHGNKRYVIIMYSILRCLSYISPRCSLHVYPEMLISYPEMVNIQQEMLIIVLVMLIVYLDSRDIVSRCAHHLSSDAHHVSRLQISYPEMLNIKPEMLKYF
jgi:hypothetical protein